MDIQANACIGASCAALSFLFYKTDAFVEYARVLRLDKFLDLSFGTKGSRLRVYRVWKLYKHISFDLKVLEALAKKHKIKFEIVVGKKDPVVSQKLCKEFHLQIGSNSNYHLIQAGHDLFKPHTVKYIGENVL